MYLKIPFFQFIKYCLVFFMLALVKISFSQTNFIVNQYTQKNGLPQNSVNQVHFDKNGFLWLATEAGLVRFDGSVFKIYNPQNSIIFNERIRWILPTFDKQLLVADAGGNFIKIENNLLHHLDKVAPTPNLINLKGGLPTLPNFLKLKQLFKHTNSKFDFSAINIIPHNQNTSYILGKKYIYKFNDDIITDSVLLPAQVSISYFFKVGAHYYLATKEGTFFYVNFRGNKIEPCQVQGIEKSKITFVSIIYKSTALNTYLIQDKNLSTIDLVGGNPRFLKLNLITKQIPDNFKVADVEYNKALNVYALGSTNNGLCILKSDFFKEQHDVNSAKLGANAVYAIDQLNDTTIFSSIQTAFGSNQVFAYNVAAGIINVEAVCNDSKNRLWFAKNDTLFYYNKSLAKSILVQVFDKPITCINAFGDSIWVGQSQKLSLIIYKNNKVSYFSHLNSTKLRIESICITPKNEVFFSTLKGLYKAIMFNGKVNSVLIIPALNIRNIYYYKNIVFATSYGNGWYAFYENKAYKMPLDKKYYLSKCHGIQIDTNQNVWLSSSNGLFETSIKHVLNYISDTTKSIYYNYYNEENGIDNSEFVGGCFPSSVQLKNGVFAFPSINGLLSFKPYAFPKRGTTNKLFIDKVEVNNVKIDFNGEIDIKPNTEVFSVFFSSPYWYNNYDVTYQYQLIGYNSKLVNVNSEEKINFTNLDEGNYVLVIKKISGKRGVNGVITLNIKVGQKYYQTLWFKILVFLIIGLLISIVIKYYSGYLVKRNATLEQKVNERTFELEQVNINLKAINEQLLLSEQENIRSLNLKSKLIAIFSHDIITPLKFISMVARNSVKITEQGDYKSILQDIDQTSRRLYENAKNILNWIKYQSTLIEVQKTNVPLYVLIEKRGELLKEVMESKNNYFINNVDPDQIIYTDRSILSIVIHNVVANATKYNNNTNIEVTFNTQKNFHHIVITDNGTGINLQNLERIKSIKNKQIVFSEAQNSESSGLGFIIINELLAILNGTFYVKSDSNGTEIIIELPIETYPVNAI